MHAKHNSLFVGLNALFLNVSEILFFLVFHYIVVVQGVHGDIYKSAYNIS
jgi:hypothetical protein